MSYPSGLKKMRDCVTHHACDCIQAHRIELGDKLAAAEKSFEKERELRSQALTAMTESFAERDHLEKRLATAVKALEFYAEKHQYVNIGMSKPLYDDQGMLAREALAQISPLRSDMNKFKDALKDKPLKNSENT